VARAGSGGFSLLVEADGGGAPRCLSHSGEGWNRGGAARWISSASSLGLRGGGLERRRRAARAKEASRFWSKIRPSGFFI
jgi:hypothetical protein